ncbi:hypothetical protein NDU88_002674 [Pleurodeles waltl]|uniref:Uncharacterized protein n=1 Tax=Pleurodeles waltl TaxID=8319 RepID=A0AAV7TMI2_PLEWA|nr:hypothetical protein NDU88_002674 [Pleurodeles waltl]
MERCPGGTFQSVGLLRCNKKEPEGDVCCVTMENGEEEDTEESTAGEDADREKEEVGGTELSGRGRMAEEDKGKIARYSSTETHKGSSKQVQR